MKTKPEPLIPADVDLRDFGFMPLDVLRLRDSDLATLSTGDEFKAAVLLWCASWHQVPSGSLPENDRLLAKYAGGLTAPEWKKVKEGALRGFVECADGRFYHSVIASKALEAWKAKHAQRARTRAATEAREAKRRAAQEARDADRHVSRDDHRHEDRDDQRDVERDAGRDVDQGIGTGIGTGREIQEKERAQHSEADARDLSGDAELPNPTQAGAVCQAMKAAGFAAVNPGDPRFTALLAQGATLDEFVSAATEAAKGLKGWPWVLKVVENRRAEAAALRLAPKAAAPDWRESRAGVINRGCALGIGAWDEVAAANRTGPSWARYRDNVIAADEQQRTAA